MTIPFPNRVEAGRLLGNKLKRYQDPPSVIVLGLPRGGVPVAAEVASALHAHLDVLLVRKLGLPGHEELAMGAIASGGIRVLDRALIAEFGIRSETIERITRQEQETLDQRERLYRAGKPPLDVRDLTVILVDDGIATGATMLAGVQAVRQMSPNRIIIATPVAAGEASERLAEEADEIVCLATPDPFFAVGAWYEDFPQVSDEEVRRLLAASVQYA